MSLPEPSPTPAAEQRWTHCPVCESEAHTEWVSFPGLSFVRCEDCGVIYKSLEADGLLPADFYEKSYFSGRRSGREKRFDERAEKSRRQLLAVGEVAEPGPTLDLGCSLGYGIEGARRLGVPAAGADLSAFAVERCRERGLRAEVGGLEDLPFEDDEFATVVMRHVLEHTPTPKRALAEVHRVLRPGGGLLVLVPDAGYWKGHRRRETYRYYRPDDLGAQHFVYYDIPTLSRLLEENGFAVKYRSKAIFRRQQAKGGPHKALWELLRWAGLSVVYGLASRLGMRRELFVIATAP